MAENRNENYASGTDIWKELMGDSSEDEKK